MAQATPGEVHRLTDMITEEVSMVDRAANKRRFLVWKRDPKTMAHGSEITPGANGTFTAGAAGAPAAAGGAPASAIVGKAGASLTQDQKDALTEAVASVVESLTNAQALIEGATIVPTEDETSADELVGSLQDGAELLEDTLSAMLGMEDPDAAEEGSETDAPPDASATPAPAGEGAMAMPTSKRLEAITAKRTIAKYEGEKLGLSIIAKYGARMAKTRLARYKTALGILTELLGEMAPAVKAALKPPAPGAKKPGAPGPSETASKTAKAAGADDAEKVALRKAADDAVALAKRLAGELASLRSNIQPTNVAAAPSGSARANADPPWPLDMNSLPPLLFTAGLA